MCFDVDRKTLDGLLVYQTVKVVRFENAKIGASYYCLVLLICFYILGYEILYCNNHFDKRDVSGTPRLSIYEPTQVGCSPGEEGCKTSFLPVDSLPYCSQYTGKVDAAEARHPCVVADRHTLLPHGALTGEMLLPTRIEEITEARSCEPGASNNYTCSNEFDTVGESGAQYVADIERFSVLISHSYRRDSISGNNNRVLGYYFECEETGSRSEQLEAALFGAKECAGQERRRPIECLDDRCHFQDPRDAPRSTPMAQPALLQRGGTAGGRAAGGMAPQRLRRRTGAAGASTAGASESGGSAVDASRWALLEDGVYAVPDGDVFTVAKLLELAGVDSLDSMKNNDGQPLREVGVVLDIAVRYENLQPITSTFGGGNVEYEYFVSLKPVHQAKDESVIASGLGLGQRVIEIRHGIYFTVRVEGFFGFFSIMNLVLAFAQGATMLTVATVVTDKIAVYLLEEADDNYHAKYKEVERKERRPVDADSKQK